MNNSEPAYCPATRRAVLMGVNHDTATSFVYSPGCHMWKCPVCGKQNQALWFVRITEGVKHYHAMGETQWSFATITSSAKLHTFDATWRVWPKAWAKLSTRLRRLQDQLRYALVPEQHEDGRVHAHLVLSLNIPHHDFKDQCAECGFGYQADMRVLTSPEQAGHYVSKYLGKQLKDKQWPKNTRRVRTSQKWPELPPLNGGYPGETQWTIIARSVLVGNVVNYLSHVKTATGYPVELIME